MNKFKGCDIFNYPGASVSGGGGGGVTGPGSSVLGNIATWADTSGDSLADSGVAITSFFINDAMVTTQTVISISTTGGTVNIEWNAGDDQFKLLNTTTAALNVNYSNDTFIAGVGIKTNNQPNPVTVIANIGVAYFTTNGVSPVNGVELKNFQDEGLIKVSIEVGNGGPVFYAKIDAKIVDGGALTCFTTVSSSTLV